MNYLPIFFRVPSQALGQSHDCPSASEVSLKDMGRTGRVSNHHKTWQYANHEHILWDILRFNERRFMDVKKALSGWSISVCRHLNLSITCSAVVHRKVVCSTFYRCNHLCTCTFTNVFVYIREDQVFSPISFQRWVFNIYLISMWYLFYWQFFPGSQSYLRCGSSGMLMAPLSWIKFFRKIIHDVYRHISPWFCLLFTIIGTIAIFTHIFLNKNKV